MYHWHFDHLPRHKIAAADHLSRHAYCANTQPLRPTADPTLTLGICNPQHDRFKLIPSIVSGPFIVRKAVGSKPALLGRKVSQRYFRGPGYVETDIGELCTKVLQACADGPHWPLKELFFNFIAIHGRKQICMYQDTVMQFGFPSSCPSRSVSPSFLP